MWPNELAPLAITPKKRVVYVAAAGIVDDSCWRTATRVNARAVEVMSERERGKESGEMAICAVTEVTRTRARRRSGENVLNAGEIVHDRGRRRLLGNGSQWCDEMWYPLSCVGKMSLVIFLIIIVEISLQSFRTSTITIG